MKIERPCGDLIRCCPLDYSKMPKTQPMSIVIHHKLLIGFAALRIDSVMWPFDEQHKVYKIVYDLFCMINRQVNGAREAQLTDCGRAMHVTNN